MTKLYWRFKIFLLALRWIPQINLGDEVWYEGEKYVVANGVRSMSWRLSGKGWVPRSKCRKVKSTRNAIRSFKSGWRFYMGYWFDIWCREGIKPWMLATNIWPGKQKKNED